MTYRITRPKSLADKGRAAQRQGIAYHFDSVLDANARMPTCRTNAFPGHYRRDTDLHVKGRRETGHATDSFARR